MADERLTELQAAERSTWLYRAVLHTKGNQTLLGCLVLAVMNKNAKNPPWLLPKGMVIAPDGTVWTGCITLEEGVKVERVLSLGNIKEVVGAWRRLADDIKASDAERIAMFDELRKHVMKDHRPQGSQLHDNLEWV